MTRGILVDTGIWIDFLHGNPAVMELKSLLSENFVFAHLLIEGELRAGSIKPRASFFESFTRLPYIASLSENLVFKWIEEEKLYSLGLSYIDLHLLASAKIEKIPIWTNDKALKNVCKKFDLAY